MTSNAAQAAPVAKGVGHRGVRSRAGRGQRRDCGVDACVPRPQAAAQRLRADKRCLQQRWYGRAPGLLRIAARAKPGPSVCLKLQGLE